MTLHERQEAGSVDEGCFGTSSPAPPSQDNSPLKKPKQRRVEPVKKCSSGRHTAQLSSSGQSRNSRRTVLTQSDDADSMRHDSVSTTCDTIFAELWFEEMRRQLRPEESNAARHACPSQSACESICWERFWPNEQRLRQWLHDTMSRARSPAEQDRLLDHLRRLACRVGPRQLSQALVNEGLLFAHYRFSSGFSALEIAVVWANCKTVDLLVDALV